MPDSLLRFVLWLLTKTHLPHSRGRARQHPGKGRRAVRLQPRLLDGRAVAPRLDRPANPVPDVQGHLRKAVDQLGRAHPRRHSHFLRTAPARTHPVAANRERRHSPRRGRLHFCRGADHAHRAVAAVPARHGTHHEGRGRAHRASRARRRDGQHLQLQTSPLRLEMATSNSASGHRQLRRAAAADRHAVRDAAGRAGTARLRLAASPRPDATAAPRSSCGRRGSFRCGLRWPTRRTRK